MSDAPDYKDTLRQNVRGSEFSHKFSFRPIKPGDIVPFPSGPILSNGLTEISPTVPFSVTGSGVSVGFGSAVTLFVNQSIADIGCPNTSADMNRNIKAGARFLGVIETYRCLYRFLVRG